MAAKPIPDDMQGVIPMLAFKDANKAIEFYKTAFGATEVSRLAMPDNKIAHAELKIGAAMIMLSDENPQYNKAPQTLGGTAVILHMYVNDVDAFFKRATTAGAKAVIPISDQFYGDRCGRLEDPFGYLWAVATHKEDLSPAEMQQRFNKMMGG